MSSALERRVGWLLPWLLVGTVVVLLAAAVVLLGRSTHTTAGAPIAVPAEGTGAPVIEMQVFVVQIDESLGTAQLLVTPRELVAGDPVTSTDHGTWRTVHPIFLTFDAAVAQDSASPREDGVFLPGRFYPPISVTARISRDPSWADNRSTLAYPFDRYAFELGSLGLYGPPDAAELTQEWEALTTIPRLMGSGDPGFDVVAEPSGDMPNSLRFTAMRTPGDIVYALAIMALILASAWLTAFMTRTIARRPRPGANPVRPPTMQGLVWAAAVTFTMIQIRDNYPSEPPIGIAADYVVLMPSLAATLVASYLVLKAWADRPDYDSTGSPIQPEQTVSADEPL